MPIAYIAQGNVQLYQPTALPTADTQRCTQPATVAPTEHAAQSQWQPTATTIQLYDLPATA